MGDLLHELTLRLPPDRLEADADVVASYASDRAMFERAGVAAVVVSPRSTAEVVLAVRAAIAADAVIVPRGAGTGLTGAANAVDGCLHLSLHRLNQIVDIDVTNRMARVQPGVINADLKRAVAEHGLFYPPDPASYESSSIGGNVATNAGGLCCVKYGVTRDYVIGLEVVLASAEVLRTGRHTLKNSAGLDLTGVFVGSEGLLGIITEVTVRLMTTPPPPATAVAFFDSLQSAGATIADVFRHGHEPSMMEIIDQASLTQVDKVYRMGLDTSAACLLLFQTEGPDSESQIEAIGDICRTAGASEVLVAPDPEEGDALVEARRRVHPALERLEKDILSEDVAVPRDRLVELLQGIVDISARFQIDMPTIGHAGDGNMHPLLVFDGSDEDETQRARAAFAAVVDLSLELGGTIAAEHGVGTLKREYLKKELDPVQMAMQHRVKRTFDPDNRLNPGKKL